MVKDLSRSIKISQIMDFIKTKDFILKDKIDFKITGFKSISTAKKGHATFCSAEGEKGLKLISESQSSLIICNQSLRKKIKRTNTSLIFVDKPRLWFIRCIREFWQFDVMKGIHKTAVVESKKIGRNVYIGPFAYVAKDVSIGDNSTIHSSASILGNTRIGRNVVIYPSAVVGSDGFGLEKNKNGEW